MYQTCVIIIFSIAIYVYIHIGCKLYVFEVIIFMQCLFIKIYLYVYQIIYSMNICNYSNPYNMGFGLLKMVHTYSS